MSDGRFRFDNYARRDPRWEKADRFDWIVFMDEPPEVLAQVSAVEYRLHETFPDPIRIQENAEDKFALHGNGWGTFTIYITVYLKDGSEAHEDYDLSFYKPWPSERPTTSETGPPDQEEEKPRPWWRRLFAP